MVVVIGELIKVIDGVALAIVMVMADEVARL